MKRNFEFDGFTVVRWGERPIDLHNAYDIESFSTDLIGSEVKLTFTRNKHAIHPDRLPPKVLLACTGEVKVAFNDLTAIAGSLGPGLIDHNQ